MKRIFISLISVATVACNEAGEKQVNRSAYQTLAGEWNNLFIRVEINSKNNSDSNEIFEVDRPKWEEKLKIKPIRSFFRADSIWNSAHYNLKDSLVYDPSGKWWVAGDKLTMLQQLPSPDTTVYTFSIKNDTASFECTVDWDMDGKKDDKYFGRQVKVKRQ
ncbi:MAG: hypothetical protein JNK14_03895 [Chitinophagaceae bacterium]|nr:hypothetical protein [Chitinophagaceae bacterium]